MADEHTFDNATTTDSTPDVDPAPKPDEPLFTASRHQATALARRAAHAAIRNLLRWIHPFTLARIAWTPALGLGLILAAAHRWVRARDLEDLRKENVERHVTVLERRGRTARRIVMLWLLASALTMIILFFQGENPDIVWQLQLATLGLAAFIVGARGRRILADAPNVRWLIPPEQFVRQAFQHAGLVKDWTEIELVRPVLSDGGADYHFEVEGPPSFTFAAVLARRVQLASGLKTSVDRLWLRPVPGNGRRVIVHVSGADPGARESARHPLAIQPRPTSVWGPIEFGVTRQSARVFGTVIAKSILLGGMPRMGKTTAALHIILAFLLDANTRIILADGKGTDSAVYEDMCDLVGDKGDPWSVVYIARTVVREINHRLDRLKQLGLRELDQDTSEREMPLWLVAIDELATFTQHPDDAIRDELTSLLGDIVRLGPTVGVVPLLTAHYPSAKVVPSDIASLIPYRWAIYCSDWMMSDAVLGKGRSSAGDRAHEIPEVPGETILRRTGEPSVQLRTYILPPHDVQKVCAYARQLRTAAGVMPNRAEKVAALPPVLLAVRAAFEAGEGAIALPSSVLVQILSEADPGTWGALTQASLASALRRYGLAPVQLGKYSPPTADGRETNLRGYRRADVEEAIRRL
jgi:S-DNA-T family DNA segregation ATPase FtsK/SpoIIIE